MEQRTKPRVGLPASTDGKQLSVTVGSGRGEREIDLASAACVLSPRPSPEQVCHASTDGKLLSVTVGSGRGERERERVTLCSHQCD